MRGNNLCSAFLQQLVMAVQVMVVVAMSTVSLSQPWFHSKWFDLKPRYLKKHLKIWNKKSKRESTLLKCLYIMIPRGV